MSSHISRICWSSQCSVLGMLHLPKTIKLLSLKGSSGATQGRQDWSLNRWRVAGKRACELEGSMG